MFGRQHREPVYRSPGGAYYKLFEDMMQQPHLLIAGTTRSGKSVIINGIVYTALLHTPERAGLILIDPKRVELVQYKDCPHVHRYASEPDEMVNALKYTLALIEHRYKVMQQERVRLYPGGEVYLIIDELADLLTTDRKRVQPLIQRICQIGRAARVHLIGATQRPTSEIINTNITVNVDARVGLRTRNAQESRNILGANGCECLPRFGKGFYQTPDGTTLYNIPMYTDNQLDELVRYWTSSRCLYRAA